MENRQKVIKGSVTVFGVSFPFQSDPQVIGTLVEPFRTRVVLGSPNLRDALGDIAAMQPEITLTVPRPAYQTFATEIPGTLLMFVGAREDMTGDLARHVGDSVDVATAPRPYFCVEVNVMRELYVMTGAPGTGRKQAAADFIRKYEEKNGPGRVSIIRTATTRKPRNLADLLFFEQMTPEQFEAKRAAGEILQAQKFGQTWYGIEKAAAAEALKRGHAICVLVESKVNELTAFDCEVLLFEPSLPNGTPPAPQEGGEAN